MLELLVFIHTIINTSELLVFIHTIINTLELLVFIHTIINTDMARSGWFKKEKSLMP